MSVLGAPIQSCEQDEFARVDFVKHLVRTILAYQDPTNLVIGLDGPLASGKTSLLNMLQEDVLTTTKYTLDEEKPILVRLDAWCFAGNLTKQFFWNLADTLANTEYLKSANLIANQIVYYANFITRELRPAWWYKIYKNMRRRNSFIEEKNIINNMLQSSKHKLIIPIDNIDKLTGEEIKQLLQIMQCFADFVNICYVLVFDKNVVIKSLDQIQKVNNAEFISNMLSLEFTVPEITQEMLETFLLHNLKKVLRRGQIKEWDEIDWQRLYDSNVTTLFHNIHEVTRYINMLAFTYDWLGIEINHIDLFILTAMRVLLPEMYNEIHNNKDLFTEFLPESFADANYVAQELARCEALLKTQQHIYTLKTLFPKLQTIYDKRKYSNEERAEWRRMHRICDPDTFNNYFALTIPKDEITPAEAQAILKNIGKSPVFIATLKGFIEDKRYFSFFALYSKYLIPKIAKKNIPIALTALLDCADLLPDYAKIFADFNIPDKIHQLATMLLAKLSSKSRFLALQTAFTDITMSLYIPICELLRQENNFSRGEIKQLQKIVVAKILAWGKENRLIEHPFLPAILQAWQQWTKSKADADFITKLLHSDENLIKFITVFLHKDIDDFRERLQRDARWQADLAEIAEFVSLKLIEPRIGKIFEDSARFKSLREREQLAVLIFLDKT